MKIYKVLVDELPNFCGDCIFWKLINGDDTPECVCMSKYVDWWDNPRPDWCPLQAVPMWEADYKTTGIIKP